MSEIELIEYIEIDVIPCSLTYGVYPCTAVLGVTGTRKCYNSPATCQVPEAFSAGSATTHRFAKSTMSLPDNIRCRPNIESIQTRAQETHPGRSLGTREMITIRFSNHLDNDVGYDNYIADRGYNTYNRGTHWGKWAARWPNLQGAELRHRIGKPGVAFSLFETRHYYIEKTSGPNAKGMYTVVAKDALKFIDGKKGQIPKPSNGVLSAALSAGATSVTLLPTGIGDLEYPADGIGSIGGEMVTFTRSGDDFTIVRGLYNTEDEDHDEDETFQLAVEYSAQDPAEIIDDMVFGTHQDGSTRTQTPAVYQNLAAWQTETDTYFGRLYSAIIARPTSIAKLVSEIIQHAGLHIWTDIIDETIRLQVLRQTTVTLAVTDEIVKPGSLDFVPEEDKRISAVWTSFGQKNPLLNLDEDGNYKAISAKYDDDEIKQLEGLPESIERVRSRWITVANRVATEEFNTLQLQRWGDTPGYMNFTIPQGYPIRLGTSISVQSRIFENDDGSEKAAQTAIVTQVQRTPGWYKCKSDLIRFRPVDTYPGNIDRVILIDEDALNINIRELYDLIYVAPADGDSVKVIIGTGVVIGSLYHGITESPDSYSLVVGDWPTGVSIEIVNNGYIVGAGGRAAQMRLVYNGVGQYSGWNVVVPIFPTVGGDALYTRYPISIDNTNGFIWGGGGGGGCNEPATNPQGTHFYAWGGDGAGRQLNDYRVIPGNPSFPPFGTDDIFAELDAGGTAGQNSFNYPPPTYGGATGLDVGNGGAGGGPGIDGGDGTSYGLFTGSVYQDMYLGKDAGNAVDGVSYVTYSVKGDVRGDEIN